MISQPVLDAALRDLFDLSPVPFSISTIDHDARYIKVNPAYLRLIGRAWAEIEGQSLGTDLPYSMDDPDRMHRMHLLDSRGFYELTEVDMLHADGRIIPTLISAQRRRIAGESLDIEIILDNSERKAFEQAILDAASTDAMTGLQNRAAFDRHLRQTLARHDGQSRLFLTYIDLNRFKRVNDKHGHSTGDRLLKAVAERLRDWAGRGDFIARLGGDEFAAISTLVADGAFSLERFLDLSTAIAAPVRIDDRLLRVGAAIGVCEAAAGADADGLLDAADRLMYAAKASGKFIDVRSDIAPDRTETNWKRMTG